MPLYGDADSIKWFEVEPNCTFHIINSFEDDHEVIHLRNETVRPRTFSDTRIDQLAWVHNLEIFYI